MTRRASVRRLTIVVVLLAAVTVAAVLVFRLRQTDVTLKFSRDDLQQRVASKFPFDQRLLFVTVTYSNPVLKMDEGSDRIGLGLDATAKLDGDQLLKGSVEGDWKIRYDPADGAFYFDEPEIKRFDIKGLSPSTQELVARVATPLIKQYLRRVPVYRFKAGDLRQDIARAVLKSAVVRQGKLYLVVGPG